MTLQELINEFRVLAKDTVHNPYLFKDPDVVRWLNEAQMEAVIRGRLLREDTWAAVCEIPLVPGTRSYKLHRLVYEIINIRLAPGNGDRSRRITLHSREWMDANRCDWRDWASTVHIPATTVIQDDTSIRLAGYAETGDKLLIECYRLPKPMAVVADEPEIHDMHHSKLVQWALHRAFSIPDADTFDAKKSEDGEDEFTTYFGPRPRSDARRRTRIDDPHHTTGYLQ